MPEDKTDFREGRLEYLSFTISNPSEMPLYVVFESPWRDGYATFSRGEVRLAMLGSHTAAHLWEERVNNLPDCEGFLMEMDLWRDDGKGTYEEISIEREDDGFFCQYWRLEMSGNKQANCYFRRAKTEPRRPLGGRPSLFGEGELLSWECVVPEHRLHFFITTGRQL